MRDKILKILKVRIDAINRNIDNLNYLNSELEKNTADLNYIQDKIDIFAANNILNFDSLSLDDFEKVLLMIDPSVSEVFQDKTCNYQGIMYIIQGIRQGISLELTDEQANAIRMLIQEMINKKASLEDVIANLNESKSRLPETEMAILTNNLKKFQTIITKIQENLYITEVDDIISSLEFANVSLEEKVGIFEFILKYNTKIYMSSQTPIAEAIKDDEFSLKEINVPEFHYEPINIYEEDKDVNDDNDDFKTSDDSKFANLEETTQIPVSFPKDEEVDVKQEEEIEPTSKAYESSPISEEVPENPLEMPNFETYEPKIQNDFEKPEESNITPIEITPFETPIETPVISSPTVNVSHQEETTETTELEDIIGKIDAKLKEMEKESKNDDTPLPLPEIEPKLSAFNSSSDIDIQEVLQKFGLDSTLSKQLVNTSHQEIEKILTVFEENQLLEIFKNNTDILVQILKLPSEEILKLIQSIKDHYITSEKELSNVMEEILNTMPLVLTNSKVLDSFVQNTTFFKVHNLSLINIFNNYREILLVDQEQIEKNYHKVRSYNITLTDDNVKYLLYNKHVLENLDYYLEAKGMEKGFLGREEEFDGYNYILKNPYKLNNISRNVLMKLRYATENNHKIFGSKQGILSGEISNPNVNTLVVPDDYKNLYFNNDYSVIESSKLETLMKELETSFDFNMQLDSELSEFDRKYKIDDLRYRIGDLTFSRPKTIRIYNFLVANDIKANNALLIALTYNSVIKKDEFGKLEGVITSLKGGN